MSNNFRSQGAGLCVQIPYRTVEVSPLTKKQLSWSEYRKVPVAVLDGEVIADSTAIITRLAAELQERHVGQDTPTRHPSNWRRLFGARSKTEVQHMRCIYAVMKQACKCGRQ